MIDKRKSQYVLVLTTILIGLTFLILFFLFSNNISENYIQYKNELDLIISIVILRIIIMAGMTTYIFREWYNQQELYLSDIPFLVGLYFYILTIGKIFDIFWVLIASYSDVQLSMILLKIRYFIILTIAPMLYLGLGILLLSMSVKYEKFTNDYINALRNKMILIFIASVSFVIIIIPDVYILSFVYPILVLPTLLGIIYLFIFAYKNKRLSQVHGLIIGIGFLSQAISSIIRPILTSIEGTKYGLWWLAEIIDLCICVIMFLGFIMKPKYHLK